MKTFQLNTTFKKILADTITPVSIYLKIRDKFPNSLLLESSDYHANDNSFSYICCNPIASFQLLKGELKTTFPDGEVQTKSLLPKDNLVNHLQIFANQFKTTNSDFKFANNGLFGYLNYDVVPYFEKTQITPKPNSIETPDVYYAVYQNIIAINHFKNEAYIFCHSTSDTNNIEEINQLI
ncbi:MAG: anthranilate synthase component 1, partial [Flavobacterium sp.]